MIGRLIAIFVIATALGIVWNLALVGGLPLVLDPSKTAVYSAELREAHSIPLDELRSLIDEGDAFLLDGRSEDDYAEEHIPSAMSVPADEAEDMADFIMSQVPPEGLVVVYCESADCYAAAHLFDFLRNLGYSDVRLFLGGLPEWKEAGLAVEEGKE